MDTISLNVLVQDTGETPRTLQHWSDLGILKPLSGTNKQGRGRHREFVSSLPWHGERRWALIASELNRLRVPLGDIRLIIDQFRKDLKDLDGPDEPLLGWQMALESHAIGKALLGGFVIIVIAISDQLKVDIKEGFYTKNIHDFKEDKPISIHLDDDDKYEDGPEILYSWIDIRLPLSFAENYSSSYLINLTQVLKPLVE